MASFLNRKQWDLNLPERKKSNVGKNRGKCNRVTLSWVSEIIFEGWSKI